MRLVGGPARVYVRGELACHDGEVLAPPGSGRFVPRAREAPQHVVAALAGVGIVLLPEDELDPHLSDGSLVRVLDDWCPPFAGYHLYYPSRRQPSPAFSLVVKALRVDATVPL